MITFAAPEYLWLLVIPAALLALWMYRVARRAIDLRRLQASRVSPLRERWSLLGDLPLWLCVVLASAALMFALARPRGGAAGLVRASLDIVVLQDGSASMYVQDVAGSRWSRSMQFLRKLGDALRWDGDRVAMTVFARIATPEIRLTHDPTTVFFFLDHLGEHPPFRLDDETAWDTNLEEGIGWGLRVLNKDREILGPSRNAPAFLLISDGEAWSGEVARAVQQMRRAHVPLFVVGVGTVAGGRMPPLPFPAEGEPPPTVSRLDRQGLRRIATEGDGEYFELDQQPDRDIANRFIDTARRSAPPIVDPALPQRADAAAATDLYWSLIAAACGLVAIGALFARRQAVLWLELAGAAAALVVAVRVLW